jgi:bacterial regulatory protein, fis family|uniref:Transcriptional regulator FleQ factor, AAA+, ATPase, c-di-GMP n=1 Tax=Siphoviridae sp. ct7OC5 TaxID=2825350 RepID=A0A8S5TSS4_9CAUD|nr:MAG TPA: Transcriptional regulator FleQ factor, AAA+, ATPase, c-di-GMP [Siphoviridae sp. ct7OC5]
MKPRKKIDNEKYTDEELKQALIKANGQPTKAAEMLGVDYSGVYRRIRKNPELEMVQKAYRARTFNDVSNLVSVIAIMGVIREPLTDEDGTVIPNQFREVPVDYRTRMTAMQTVLSTFKTDDGIREEVAVQGSIDIAQWLKSNSKSND